MTGPPPPPTGGQPAQHHVTFQPMQRPRFVAFRAKKTNHVGHFAGSCFTLGLWLPIWAIIWVARMMWNLCLLGGWATVVACQWLWWVAVGRRRAQQVHTYTYNQPPQHPGPPPGR